MGDPIYAASGQAYQVETDYAGVSGLNYTRTYRSNQGYYASVQKQWLFNNSAPAGTTSPACYYGQWTIGTQSGWHCFLYMSVYPYVNNGIPTFVLNTGDGRAISFWGSSSYATSADVNDRLSAITFNGSSAFQVNREDDSIEIYSYAGSLLQKTLRGGQKYTYTYSTSSTPTNIAPWPGLLLTQSDAFGHTLSWQYNSLGLMSQMTDPAGGIYQYSYDANGNLTGVLYPDSKSKTYWYNESANTGGANLPQALTGITDESAVRYATYQYESHGLAVNTQLAGGVNSYTLSYSPISLYLPITQAQVTDPLGTNRTYNFTQSLSYNRDSAQTQPAASGSGTATQSELYDANGNLQQITDFNGNVTTYLYDQTRNLETSRTEAYGTAQARTITTTWDSTWRQPKLITEPNRTTGYTYDNLGNVLTKTITDTTVTPNVTRVWTYTYDTYGRMKTAVGPRTDVVSKTTYAYYTCTTGYQCGQVNTITDAVGNVWTFNTYNAHGLPLTITDPNGIVTTLTYDARLRLKSRQIGTETTSYTYWPTGLLQLVTQPDGSTIQYTYDGAHRLYLITDSAGNYIQYTLDNMGNRTGENTYDPGNTLHRKHTRAFNAINQLYQDINSAGSSAVTTTYGDDNNGNVLTVAAPLGRTTGNLYDALNRLTQITDPSSGVAYPGYDANDNLASVKDPRGFTTSYNHNGFGDVTQIVSPDTGTTVNTYDSGGNLKTVTDARSALATYTYDKLDRVTKIVYSDDTINYGYDASSTNNSGKGHLTSASNTGNSMAWNYDTLGRVNGKGQTIGSTTLAVGYTYTNGDMTSMLTPSQQMVVYGYTNHRITSITINGTTILSGVTYDPFGPATGWTWGNNTQSVSRSFDQDGNPAQFVTAATTNTYTVDYASRITGISDSTLPSNSLTIGYDLLDRVTGVTSSALNHGYQYDANGNRTVTTGTPASTETISTTNNQLNAVTGSPARTYSAYDAAGNTQGYTGETFTFNQRGRMNSATSGSTTNYVYNALGQLVKKSGNGGTTLLMYDEAGHLIGEYNSAGALVQETIWMGDIPVATIRPGSPVVIYYVHADHLGTPRKVTNTSNAVVWRWDPDAFGTAAPSVTTITYNLRFPGQYYLAESGLFYNYFRTYDPQMGRYLESDPAGLDADSYSTYSYVAGDPIDYDDPDGLYRVKNAQVPIPSPALDSLLHCMEAILGMQMTVTSTTDGKHQDPGHYAGTSIDIRPPATARAEDVFCAAGNCGAAWGLNESKGAQKFKYTTGANLHLQLNPPHHPRPTAPNAIPARCKPGVCSK